MTNSCFILAQHGTKVELIEGDFQEYDVGEAFLRMPARTNEWWQVIKRFEGNDHDRLSALVKLMGFDKAKTLFGLTVLEDHTIAEAFTPPTEVA